MATETMSNLNQHIETCFNWPVKSGSATPEIINYLRRYAA
jgi:hypothetical protein